MKEKLKEIPRLAIFHNRTFYKMREIVELLFEHFNPKLRVKFELENDSKTGYIAPLSYNLSTEKLEQLGWEPKTDLYKIYELDLERFKKCGQN